MTPEQETFLLEALDVIAVGELCDEVWWHSTGGRKPPYFLVICNDFFYWGCADCEPITRENLPQLRAAITECEHIPNFEGSGWAALLFCAKVRGLRPQGCCYPKEAVLWPLFDACGPKRVVDFDNPHEHPADGGQYAYRSEQTCGLPTTGDAGSS